MGNSTSNEKTVDFSYYPSIFPVSSPNSPSSNLLPPSSSIKKYERKFKKKSLVHCSPPSPPHPSSSHQNLSGVPVITSSPFKNLFNSTSSSSYTNSSYSSSSSTDSSTSQSIVSSIFPSRHTVFQSTISPCHIIEEIPKFDISEEETSVDSSSFSTSNELSTSSSLSSSSSPSSPSSLSSSSSSSFRSSSSFAISSYEALQRYKSSLSNTSHPSTLNSSRSLSIPFFSSSSLSHPITVDSSSLSFSSSSLTTSNNLIKILKNNSQKIKNNNYNFCFLCKNFYTKNDKISTLPYCSHFCHFSCFQLWFQFHTSCPICRREYIMKEEENLDNVNKTIENKEVFDKNEEIEKIINEEIVKKSVEAEEEEREEEEQEDKEEKEEVENELEEEVDDDQEEIQEIETYNQTNEQIDENKDLKESSTKIILNMEDDKKKNNKDNKIENISNYYEKNNKKKKVKILKRKKIKQEKEIYIVNRQFFYTLSQSDLLKLSLKLNVSIIDKITLTQSSLASAILNTNRVKLVDYITSEHKFINLLT